MIQIVHRKVFSAAPEQELLEEIKKNSKFSFIPNENKVPDIHLLIKMGHPRHKGIGSKYTVSQTLNQGGQARAFSFLVGRTAPASAVSPALSNSNPESQPLPGIAPRTGLNQIVYWG